MSASDETSAKLCPRCRSPLDPAAYAAGKPFACGRCGAKVQRNPTADASFDVPPVAQPVAEDDWLADLQALLIRMLIGIPQFIFVKLPSEIWLRLRRWFPTMVRVAIILVLGTLWLGVALGPMTYSLLREGRGVGWTEVSAPTPDFYAQYAAWFDNGIAAYTILALYGSLWKALQGVKRYRAKRLAANARATGDR